ncbi:MAG: YeeE/YedE thiosulfate transporter family protein [Armatimonadota bacterium]|nr:YeeE/YedE thiosulfate transporter family protein [Armatimonadota bacterium]MDW8290929.1 YeeE/YedE thiosulfate transporter family protein [Armatimonadota bacterium]
MKDNEYMNPYLAGILLGVLLVLTIYITGRGLGASGAIKSVVVTGVNAAAPQHAQSVEFYREYLEEHRDGGPLKNWLVFEVVGMFIGAFLSGLAAGRLKWVTEGGPRVASRTRLLAAFLGGILWGIGSQLGRGCTSGAALSGLAVMATGGILTMLAIFAGAYAFAFFFRKLWT